VARVVWESRRAWIQKTQAVKLGAQPVWIKPGGLADNWEILLVLEKVFFGLTFRAERTRNPLLNDCYDYSLPEAHFKASRRFAQYPCTCGHCSPVCAGPGPAETVPARGNHLAKRFCDCDVSLCDVLLQ